MFFDTTKKATESVFRGFAGFFIYSSGKNLIESPLNHGFLLPCCLACDVQGEMLHAVHGLNIENIHGAVKVFF
jgi:hypothetical protein